MTVSAVMPHRIAARSVLSGFRLGATTLERIAAIGVNLLVRGHGELACKLISLLQF
jgi:hypothetical protein